MAEILYKVFCLFKKEIFSEKSTNDLDQMVNGYKKIYTL